jgi:hypothetical protein
MIQEKFFLVKNFLQDSVQVDQISNLSQVYFSWDQIFLFFNFFFNPNQGC